MSTTEYQDPDEPRGAEDSPEIALSPRYELLYEAWLEATQRTALPEAQKAEFIREAEKLALPGRYTYRELVEAGRRARTRSSSGTAYILRLRPWAVQLKVPHARSKAVATRFSAASATRVPSPGGISKCQICEYRGQEVGRPCAGCGALVTAMNLVEQQRLAEPPGFGSPYRREG